MPTGAVAALDDGRVIVDYLGMAIRQPGGPHFDGSHVKACITLMRVLRHLNACLSGSFAFSEDSLGEMFLAPHGNRRFWGTTNFSYWDEDDILERGLFDTLFRTESARLTWQTSKRSKRCGRTTPMQAIRATIMKYNLLGDPTTELL